MIHHLTSEIFRSWSVENLFIISCHLEDGTLSMLQRDFSFLVSGKYIYNLLPLGGWYTKHVTT